jgi:hypothetical protein
MSSLIFVTDVSMHIVFSAFAVSALSLEARPQPGACFNRYQISQCEPFKAINRLLLEVVCLQFSCFSNMKYTIYIRVYFTF